MFVRVSGPARDPTTANVRRAMQDRVIPRRDHPVHDDPGPGAPSLREPSHLTFPQKAPVKGFTGAFIWELDT